MWLSRALLFAQPAGVPGAWLPVCLVPLLLPSRACVRVVRRGRTHRFCVTCMSAMHGAETRASSQQTARAASSILPAAVTVCSLLLLWLLHVWLPGGSWEALSPACSRPQLVPLCLTPVAAESCTQSSAAALEGCFVPWSLCLVDFPWGHFRELCWRASKVKVSV